MPANSGTHQVLFAPLPNYKGVPTINVCSHEVPLPVYWRIAELLAEGIGEEQIVRTIVNQTGVKSQRSVDDIVSAISKNLRQIESASPIPAIPIIVNEKPKASNRLSALLSKRAKRVSTYRESSRLEAHHEIEDVGPELEAQEKQKQLDTARALARRKEMLEEASSGSKKISKDERRRTIAAIDHDINKSLHRYAEIETQMEYARRLTCVQKGTSA
ncbi:hypothetical protein LTR84_005288 [Exophiala bonariae]|uniref:Uncharacterized protein n=1 Tax=Exophiala bonariae TaxID=1690606 RepID=A0AAV9NR35_9EURO|nr:hypothetical protein LTR84_005288 [Exophiala bonariae]